MAQIVQMSANCKVKSIWRSFIKAEERGMGGKGKGRERGRNERRMEGRGEATPLPNILSKNCQFCVHRCC